MLSLDPLLEFSRTHCIAICTVLVPANLLATLQTMILAGLGRPLRQVCGMAIVSGLYALLLFLHVLSWWAIGVVMSPTYILSALATVCLLTNLGAVALRSSQRQLLKPFLTLVLARLIPELQRSTSSPQTLSQTAKGRA